MNIGAFGVDPGGSTGLAWGIFDPGRSVADALLTKMNSGSVTVTGDERTQIREVCEVWRSFYNTCVKDALLPIDHVYLVMEDYIYVPGVAYTGDSASISTALIWGIEGYRMGRRDEWAATHRGPAVLPPMILQTASQAKGFATNARLKEWGVWVKGRDHERSAWQHVAYFLQRYMLQHKH